MQSAIKLRTAELPRRRIEMTAPELHEGDEVELIVLAGTPAASEPNGAHKQSALDIIEGPHGRRLFQSPADVDDYLAAERDSWDR